MNQPLPPFSCIYTPNIPELLQQLQCTIAISTYQAGKVVFIGAKDKNLLVQLGKTIKKPMGIAYDGNRLAIAGQDSVYLYSSAPMLADSYPRQPNTYDNLFVPRAQYFTGITDIHDLVWLQDKLLMVNTKFSCLAWLTDQYSFMPCWQPRFISQLMPDDRCHLNGVAVHNNQPQYVSMFSNTDTASGWRDTRTTSGLIMDVQSNEVVAANLAMPHTPRIINNNLYVLLSATGELVQIDAQSGKYTVVKNFGRYVRGMAYHNGYLFVAFSKIREKSSTFSDMAIATASQEAGIAVLHLQSATIVGEIKYQNSVEEIYDVQILPYLRPGMVNFDQPEKTLALSLPGGGFWGIVNEE